MIDRAHGRRTWSAPALALVACGVAFLVFGRTIGYGFTYDDIPIIVKNALVHDAANWSALLTARWWNDAAYRPLTLVSFAVNWAAGSGAPVGFHAVNVLLHVLNTALVFLLARRWIGQGGAAAAALLFAVHPVHVEAVANVVGRAELLATAGVLGATLAYLAETGTVGRRRAFWWTVALLAGLVALAGKETGFVLPGLLLVADWVAAAKEHEPLRSRLRRRLPLWSAMFILWVVWLLWWFYRMQGVTPGIAPGLQGLGPLARALAMLAVIPQYARLLLVPLRLSADYSPRFLVAAPVFSAAALLGVAVLVATVVAIVAGRSRWPVVAFGLAWCVVSLTVVSNVVVPTEVLLAERTLYLASVGVAIALGALAGRLRFRYPRGAVAGVGVVAALGFFRSVTRDPVWRSNDDLFPSIVRDAPGSYRGEWLSGMLAYQEGRRAEGRLHLEAAVAIDSSDVGLLSDLADRLEEDTSWTAAGTRLDLAFRLKPAALLYAARAVDDYVRGHDLSRGDRLLALAWPLDSTYIPLRIAHSDLAEEHGELSLATDLRRGVARETGAWQYWLMTAVVAERAGRCDALDEALLRVRSIAAAASVVTPLLARRKSVRCRPS